jgi:hypothetical protein
MVQVRLVGKTRAEVELALHRLREAFSEVVASPLRSRRDGKFSTYCRCKF